MALPIVMRILAVIFFLSGITKLAALNFEVAAFMRWGYPLWFMYLTGGIEAIGGLVLLYRRMAPFAAAGFAVMMLGAIATRLLHAEWGMAVVAVIITGLCVWCAIKSGALQVLKR